MRAAFTSISNSFKSAINGIRNCAKIHESRLRWWMPDENQWVCTVKLILLDSHLVMQYIECLGVRWQSWYFFKTVQQ